MTEADPLADLTGFQRDCLVSVARLGNLLDKSQRDRRTNEYTVTARGRRELDLHAEWVVSGIDRDLTNGDGGLDELFPDSEESEA